MPELALLQDLVVLFGIGVAIVALVNRLGVPPIVGFLVTGVLAGPHGLGLIRNVHEVELLAEIGVVLLLFTVGIEFSIQELVRLRTFLLIGGGLQVVLTAALTAVVLQVTNAPLATALFAGMLVSLSSTAIVMRVLAEKGELEAPHGRAALGILIFQDLAIVLMVLLVPFLGTGQVEPLEFGWVIVKSLLFVGGAILAARYAVPHMLEFVANTRTRETFILATILLVLGTAWLSARMGLSLSLGAFVAGLVVSESEYSHQALGEILPFRDAFNSLFFISVGMLFDPQMFIAAPLILVTLMATVIVGKALIVGAVTLLLGYPVRTALISGLTLAQVGEFSFVVSRAGDAYGLFDTHWNQLFLGTAVGTMALTPTLITLAPGFAAWVENTLPSKWTLRTDKRSPDAEDQLRLEDHVIIVGFGMVGRNLARVLQYVDVPFVVIDLNPQTVHKYREEGVPIIYGDASRPEILRHACLANSRVVVIAISDPPAAQRAVETIRRLNAGTHIIIRSRYFHESEPLYDLGANEVVPEEFEVSIEIFSRTLHHYLVPRGEIETYVRELRHEGYGVLRTPLPGEPAGPELDPFLVGSAFRVFEVEKGSGAVGHTLSELELPAKYGITILAIRSSDGELNVAPGAQFKLEPGDSLLVLGTPEALTAVGQECRLQRPE